MATRSLSDDGNVRLGVVSHCTVSNNTKLISQIIQQFGFELGPSISGDRGCGTKTRYPPAEESISDRFSFKIDCCGFRPTRHKSINT